MDAVDAVINQTTRKKSSMIWNAGKFLFKLQNLFFGTEIGIFAEKQDYEVRCG